MKLTPAQIEPSIAAFRPRHKQFKADRPWIWTLTLVEGAPTSSVFRSLNGTTIKDIVRIELALPRQSVEEAQLWKYLKSRPRRQDGAAPDR